MFIIKRLALALAITVAVLIPATAGGQGAPAAASGVAEGKCPRGLHDVGDYRWYAGRVYKRESVSRRAHRRLAYMLKCQHSAWALRMVERYHRRFKRAREARALAARVFPVRDHLRRIAQCESGGNPRAVSPNGMYRGKYQFSFSTWASVGGRGDPAAASEYEQDMRAEILYRTGGPGHWPVCQHR
jgi:hypothetical protein